MFRAVTWPRIVLLQRTLISTYGIVAPYFVGFVKLTFAWRVKLVLLVLMICISPTDWLSFGKLKPGVESDPLALEMAIAKAH